MPTRSLAALAALFCCALLSPAAPAAHAAGPRHDAAERAVVRAVNVVRARHGLARVRSARALARAADAHSRDMLRRGFFAHASSDGTGFAARVGRYVRAQGVGETLARFSGGALSARAIVAMWAASPPHRAILLTRSYRRIGVGLRAGLVTADFATRR